MRCRAVRQCNAPNPESRHRAATDNILLETAACVLHEGRTRAVFDRRGWGLNPLPAKISDPPAAIKNARGRLSMYLCISTVVDFNSQNFDPPNEI